MQVRKISTIGFMSYADRATLKLPPVGLVLVTGRNGAGKSSFVEAVSYAAWGKTLRGTDPRRVGESGGVELITGFGLEATRFWTEGHKNELAVWHRLGSDLDKRTDGDQQYEFDTVSKAQDHLTGVLGEWDTWRRSCAFSSADDLSFATATDAERKRLLESLLGLQRFDTALERCRTDRYQIAPQLAAADREVWRLRTARDTATQSLTALEAVAGMAAPQQDTTGLRARLKVLEEMLPSREKLVQDEDAQANAYRTRLAEWEARERGLKVQIRELTGSATCPVCDQEWPDLAARESKRKGYEEQLAEHQVNRPAQLEGNARAQALRSLQDCQRGIAELRGQVDNADAAAKRYAEAQALVATAKLALLDMEDQLDAQTAVAEDLALQHKHLETVESVLGTKGARAHMLHDALTGLEAVANLWLDRIARTDAPLRLKLSPYTEKKTGGTADAISLEVVGAGGGRGYRAASGGEQRRIDVALMLALAQVAQMADGRVAPTMFFDEVFDALDGPGREAVAAVLDQLAQDRCVVVMTHSAELERILVADLRVDVTDGKINIA